MAYRIDYPWEKEKQLIQSRPVFIKMIPGTVIIILLLLIRLLVPEAEAFSHNLFHPLTDSPTVHAFFDMIAHVEEGTPLQEAVLTFCDDILSGEQ